jgi:hypothetical protein
LGTGAHIHRAEFRDSIALNEKNLSIPFLISQSTTPVYLNNPGYTIVDLEDTIQVMKQSLQLQYFIMFSKQVWTLEDPREDYKLDFNEPETLNKYF